MPKIKILCPFISFYSEQPRRFGSNSSQNALKVSPSRSVIL
ncbi:hypothetical protein V6Z12_D04G082500 [Gossypium hirsutum]